MKRYKIVCSDLDGTLLNNNSEISKENLKAIDELVEHGVYFVPSTGRAYGEIPEELRDNSAIRFMICSNGAVLLDRQEKKSYLTCMTNDMVAKIFAILSNFEAHVSLRQGGICYADANGSNVDAYNYYNMCEPHRDVIRKYGHLKTILMSFV